jgi:hypothetical protein
VVGLGSETVGADTLVTGRGGNEHTGRGGVHERDLGRGQHGVLLGAADREVDHVDTVEDRLVDRREDAVVVAAAAVVVLPAHLVRRDPGRRRHAADVSLRLTVDDGGNAVVACRRAGGVRAVAVPVARREEVLVRDGLFRRVVARADQLVVAGDRLLFAGHALALPLGGDRVGVGAGLGQRGEARVLRGDAGVDDADDHALTRVLVTLELPLPDAVRPFEAEEPGGVGGLRLELLPLPDVLDTGGGAQLLHLRTGELEGSAVENGVVLVHRLLAGETCLRQRGGTPALQILAVGVVVPRLRVEFASGGWLGRRDPVDAARIGGQRVVVELNDVKAGLGRVSGRRGLGVGGARHCDHRDRRCRDGDRGRAPSY